MLCREAVAYSCIIVAWWSGSGGILVWILPIHKIWALCGIFSAISVPLTTENSDDLEIRVPYR